MDMEEAEQAKTVGLHIRGKVIIKQGGSIDETDKARHYWHRCALRYACRLVGACC